MAGSLYSLGGGDPFELDLSWLPSGGKFIGPLEYQDSPWFIGPPEGPKGTRVDTSAKTIRTLGVITTVFGALGAAVGSYYEAEAAKYEARSEASAMEHQAQIANINARMAETDAQMALFSGRQEIANLTMQAGAQKEQARAGAAARGVRVGVGSTADVAASFDYVKEANVNAISARAMREARANRTQAASYRAQAGIGLASATNIRASARLVRPFGAAGGSLLGSIGRIGSDWADDRRWRGRS